MTGPSRKNRFEVSLGNIETLAGEFVKENFSLIILAFFIACMAFGYELFNFTLTIDAELRSFDSGGLEWLRQERWSTFLLLKLVMPESLIPFIPTLVSLIFLVAACFILFLIIDGDKISKVIFLLTFLTFPSAAFFMEFNTFNFAVSAGLASILAGFFFFKRFTETRENVYLLLSIIFTTFSIGTYQSMLTVWLCILFLYLVQENVYSKTEGKIIANLVVAVLILSISLILYKIIALTFLKLYHLDRSTYLENFIGGANIGYAQIINRFARYLADHFSGKGFYGEITIVSIWLIIPFIIFQAARKKRTSLKIAGVLFLVALLISPFGVSIALGSMLPVRSLVGLPLMVGGLWYIASLNAQNQLKYIFLLICVLMAFHNSFSITRLFYADYLSKQADRDFANRILDKMYDEVDMHYDGTHPIPVAIIGNKGYSSNTALIKDEVFGSSFFEWEGGNPWRIISFMKLLGVQEFEVAKIEQLKTAVKESGKMQNWPHKGSVSYTGGILIVKLSDITAAQLARYNK